MIVVRWNYASSVAHVRATRCRLPTKRLELQQRRRAARPERPAGAPGDNATLIENTPIQAKLQL
jgi:hypothetical protein